MYFCWRARPPYATPCFCSQFEATAEKKFLRRQVIQSNKAQVRVVETESKNYDVIRFLNPFFGPTDMRAVRDRLANQLNALQASFPSIVASELGIFDRSGKVGGKAG